METGLSIPKTCSGAAQIQLFLRYGDPQEIGFQERWIDRWFVQKSFPWFPRKFIQIHKHFRPMLEAAFRQLELLGLNSEIRHIGEVFHVRRIRGSREVLSLHSWGCAIDMNVLENPLGCEGNWTESFLLVMRDAQIFCGQDWTGRKDPMHFAMLQG
jgi:hypothetical protein